MKRLGKRVLAAAPGGVMLLTPAPIGSVTVNKIFSPHS